MAKKLKDEDTIGAIPRLGTPEGESAAARTIEAYRPENLVDLQGVSHSPATVQERTGADLTYRVKDTLANDWAAEAAGGDTIASPRMDATFSDVAVRRKGKQRPMGIASADAAEPTSVALPPVTGPRYKRVANPYENAAPGYGGTSMIANRAGEIVDLSGRSDIGTPGRSAVYPNGAVPGFNNQDLVDLYGGPARSAMPDEQWKAQIAQNSAMPEGYVWDASQGQAIQTDPRKEVSNTWQGADGKPLMVRGADGKQRPMTQTGTDAELSFDAPNRRALPAIDLSGPGAMLQSALPYVAQNNRERQKALRIQQERQWFKEKHGVDLNEYDLRLKAQKAQSDMALNQANIGKLNAEAAALPGKGTAAGGKLSLDQSKHLTELFEMYPSSFDAIAGLAKNTEEERETLRPQRLREMLGYGAIQDAGAATAQQPAPAAQSPAQADRKRQIEEQLKARGIQITRG